MCGCATVCALCLSVKQLLHIRQPAVISRYYTEWKLCKRDVFERRSETSSVMSCLFARAGRIEEKHMAHTYLHVVGLI